MKESKLATYFLAFISILLIGFMVVNLPRVKKQETPETYSHRLVYQFKAGDGPTPEYYQLWEINGERHLIVLPQREVSR